MTHLSDVTTQVLLYLGDVNQAVYADELIITALRFALQDYNLVKPCLAEVVLQLQQDGYEIDCSSLGEINGVRYIFYPYYSEQNIGKFGKNLAVRWEFLQLHSGSKLLLFTQGKTMPRIGEQVRLIYTKPHQLHGLDGASSTSLPLAHFPILVRATAGYALMHSASNRSDVLDKSLCQKIAQNLLEDYQHTLNLLAQEEQRSHAIISWQEEDKFGRIY